jgi:hypothetical protein
MRRLAGIAALGLVTGLSAAAPQATPFADAATPTPSPAKSPGPGAAGGGAASPDARPIGTGGSSLADIARRQKETREREGKKSSLGVITNESLRKGGAAPAASPAAGKGTAKPKTPGPAPGATPPATAVLPEFRDLKGRSEADWRRLMVEARRTFDYSEMNAKKLEAEVRRLENDFYAWSDGNYRERVIRPALDRAREDLAKTRLETDAARNRLADLEEEARKSGAPPGWLR